MSALLRRIGVVLWWFGTICLGLGAAIWLLNEREVRACGETLATKVEIDRFDAAAREKYLSARPKPTTEKEKLFISDAVLTELDVAANAPRDPRDTDTFKAAYESCEHRRSDLMPLAIGGISLLMSWTLAFVLGGSFWKPPRLY